MKVGVPKEIKPDEYRVAMLPVGALELTQAGHTVLIESGAGRGSGIAEEAYADSGATIVAHAEEIWAEADLVVKVKEPQPAEWPHLRPDQVVFTYFHFAADLAPDARHHRQRHHGNRLRDPARFPRRPSPLDPDERSCRANEHPGRRQVPRAAPGRPRNLAFGRPRRCPRRDRDPGRRSRRVQRRQGRRRHGC